MSGERRFRFGAVAGFGQSGQEWATTARQLERLGFSTLLCPDVTGTFAPFQTLAAVRARYAGSDEASGNDAVRGVQQPRPPVLIAGSGPRMLRLAAREADALALSLQPRSTEDDLAAKTAEVREIVGGRFDELELNLNIALVGEQAPPYAAAWLGADPSELISGGSITVLTGSARQMADTLLRRRDRSAVSYISVNAMFAEKFAPVIGLLAGA
jgi:alkanesulfonate monooxygenase SsuD/methylene tetrahydromethanopterin reductase-like flavin-dependent oxidoreductase (luciferase family)